MRSNLRKTLTCSALVGTCMVPVSALAMNGFDFRGELAAVTTRYLADTTGAASRIDRRLQADLRLRHRAANLSTGWVVHVEEWLNGTQDDYLDVAEGWVRYEMDAGSLLVGRDIVSWPTLHLFDNSDLLNPRDRTGADPHGRKLGEIMVRTSLHSVGYSLEGYFLPMFREPEYFLPKGRTLPPASMLDSSQFDGHTSAQRPGYALRAEYQGNNGLAGIYGYRGYQKEPAFVLARASDGSVLTRSAFSYGTNVRLHGEYYLAAWDVIGRGEILWANGHLNRTGLEDHPYAAVGGGIEKGFSFNWFEDVHVTMLLEYYRDTRGSLSNQAHYDAVGVGARFEFNDITRSALNFAISRNGWSNDSILEIEFERRIVDDVVLRLIWRTYDGWQMSRPTGNLNNEDHVDIMISAYF